MAPPAIHVDPLVQLSHLAVIARRRGLSFGQFWTEAVRENAPLIMVNHASPPEGAVRWPTDKAARLPWMRAVYATRDGWERSYNRVPAQKCERALSLLGDSLGALDRVAGERAERELEDGLSRREPLPSAA